MSLTTKTIRTLSPRFSPLPGRRVAARMTTALLTASLLAAALGTAPARAASVTHTATFPISPYLFGGSSHTFPTAAVPKFDLAGQCLTSVCVKLDGAITGLIAFENYQNYPVVVNAAIEAAITLQRPDLTTLVAVQPIYSVTDSLPIYDNVLDYGGTSGRTYNNVGATDADSLCVSTNADLALFTGAGTISLPGFATDLSAQTGASSWSLGERAYATITVTYNYSACPVPARQTTWSGVKSLYR